MMWQPIAYGFDGSGNIDLPTAAPFDGKPVLVFTTTGVVEAWWCPREPAEDHEGMDISSGFVWVCYDDTFQLELDEPSHWMPLPAPPTEGEHP
jgi:hypothetical protein